MVCFTEKILLKKHYLKYLFKNIVNLNMRKTLSVIFIFALWFINPANADSEWQGSCYIEYDGQVVVDNEICSIRQNGFATTRTSATSPNHSSKCSQCKQRWPTGKPPQLPKSKRPHRERTRLSLSTPSPKMKWLSRLSPRLALLNATSWPSSWITNSEQAHTCSRLRMWPQACHRGCKWSICAFSWSSST